MDIKTGSSGAGSWATSCGWVVGVGVLEGSDVREEGLIGGGVSIEFDGEECVGNCGVYIESSEDGSSLDASCGEGASGEGEDFVVEGESVDFKFDIVVGIEKEVGIGNSSD